jgi:hypothetical protein
MGPVRIDGALGTLLLRNPHSVDRDAVEACPFRSVFRIPLDTRGG